MSLFGSLSRGILSLAFGALLGSTIAAAAPAMSVTPILAPAGALVGAMLGHRPLRRVPLSGGGAVAARAAVGLSLAPIPVGLVSGSVPAAIVGVWLMATVTVAMSGLGAVAGGSAHPDEVVSGRKRVEIEAVQVEIA